MFTICVNASNEPSNSTISPPNSLHKSLCSLYNILSGYFSESGAISLTELLAGADAEVEDPGLTVQDIAKEIATGGWPGIRGLSTDRSLRAVRDYLDEIRRVDVSRVTGVRRDPDKVGRLLHSLARNVSTYAAATTLSQDTGGADGPLKDDTVRDYLDALGRLMIVEDQPAWAPHMRSRYVLRRAAKRHFVDPSLAVSRFARRPRASSDGSQLIGFSFRVVGCTRSAYLRAVDRCPSPPISRQQWPRG